MQQLSVTHNLWLPHCMQLFNTAVLLAAKNANDEKIMKLLVHKKANIEAKNLTVRLDVIIVCDAPMTDN